MSALTYRFDGKLYRAQRERQGLSREELAVRLGCSYALVQAVELDRHIIKVDKAARFAAALGCRVDDFLVPVDEPVSA